MDDARGPRGLGREQILLKMKAFDPEGSYFALTLGANRRGQPFWLLPTSLSGDLAAAFREDGSATLDEHYGP